MNRCSVFLLFFCVVILACTNPKRKDVAVSSDDRYNKIKKEFCGKKLESIKSIIPDSLFGLSKYKKLFVYTGQDCQSCVDAGFRVVEKIDSAFAERQFFVVSCNSNINFDQQRNLYMNFVYSDDNEIIRKELKFIYTPILLLLNSDNEIVDLYFPKTNTDVSVMADVITGAMLN